MTQENFFIDDNFYRKIEDYLIYAEIEKEDIEQLPEDHTVTVEETTLEPCLQLNMDWIVRHLTSPMEDFNDILPEDSEDVFKRIDAAIRESVDLDKLNSRLPKFYYPNGKKSELTKEDLLNAS